VDIKERLQTVHIRVGTCNSMLLMTGYGTGEVLAREPQLNRFLAFKLYKLSCNSKLVLVLYAGVWNYEGGFTCPTVYNADNNPFPCLYSVQMHGAGTNSQKTRCYKRYLSNIHNI